MLKYGQTSTCAKPVVLLNREIKKTPEGNSAKWRERGNVGNQPTKRPVDVHGGRGRPISSVAGRFPPGGQPKRREAWDSFNPRDWWSPQSGHFQSPTSGRLWNQPLGSVLVWSWYPSGPFFLFKGIQSNRTKFGGSPPPKKKTNKHRRPLPRQRRWWNPLSGVKIRAVSGGTCRRRDPRRGPYFDPRGMTRPSGMSIAPYTFTQVNGYAEQISGWSFFGVGTLCLWFQRKAKRKTDIHFVVPLKMRHTQIA